MEANGCVAGMLVAGIATLLGVPTAASALDIQGGQVDLAVVRVSAPASVQSGKKVRVTVRLQNKSAVDVTGGSVDVEIGKSSRRITDVALKKRGSGTIKVEGVVKGVGVCRVSARIEPPGGVSDPNPANNQAATRMRVTAAGAAKTSATYDTHELEEVSLTYQRIEMEPSQASKPRPAK